MFRENHTIDVDAADAPPLLPSNQFDALGRAVPAWLRQGGEGDTAGQVQFSVGDSALFDAQTAQQLVAQGIVEEVERVYQRELSDYELLFHELYRERTAIEDKNRVAEQDIGVLTTATEKANASIAYREQEKGKLQQDLSGYQHEREQITKYRTALDERYRETLRELSQLYRESARLAQRLSEESRRVQELVDARTQDAGL